MNVPPSLIILTVVLLFFILFLAIAINETLPTFIRSEFDTICTKYFNQMIINGGLSSLDVINIKDELNDLNLTNVNVNIYLDSNKNNEVLAGNKIEWGKKATLLVQSIYEYETVSPDGKGNKKNKQHTLNYENTSTILSLDNK